MMCLTDASKQMSLLMDQGRIKQLLELVRGILKKGLLHELIKLDIPHYGNFSRLTFVHRSVREMLIFFGYDNRRKVRAWTESFSIGPEAIARLINSDLVCLDSIFRERHRRIQTSGWTLEHENKDELFKRYMSRWNVKIMKDIEFLLVENIEPVKQILKAFLLDSVVDEVGDLLWDQDYQRFRCTGVRKRKRSDIH